MRSTYGKIIRLATKRDARALLTIYAPYVTETAISFENTVPAISEFEARMERIMADYPWLVCEIDGKVVGYAYASKHRERAAYQWSADLSVYVDAGYHRQHIATALYRGVTEILKLQGYYTAFAGITTPNQNSERFHLWFGFEPVGIFRKVGFKNKEWRDVKWFELPLSDYDTEPKPPVCFHKMKESEAVISLIESAQRDLREGVN